MSRKNRVVLICVILAFVLALGIAYIQNYIKEQKTKEEVESIFAEAGKRGKETVKVKETSNLKTSQKTDEYPDLVIELYGSFRSVVSQINTGIGIGELSADSGTMHTSVTTFDYSTYEFSIGKSKVRISYTDGKCSGYSISFSDDESNQDVKEILTITISATEGIAYQEAQEEMQVLVNSFSGEGQSDAVILRSARYLLTKYGSSPIDGLTLEILFREGEDVFVESEYPELNSDYMKATLNQGDRGKITGTVISDKREKIANKIEVKNSEGIFLVYYRAIRFSGEFSVGETYVFYGQIAKSVDGYSGCLRIDYLKKCDNSYIELEETSSTENIYETNETHKTEESTSISFASESTDETYASESESIDPIETSTASAPSQPTSIPSERVGYVSCTIYVYVGDWYDSNNEYSFTETITEYKGKKFKGPWNDSIQGYIADYESQQLAYEYLNSKVEELKKAWGRDDLTWTCPIFNQI